MLRSTFRPQLFSVTRCATIAISAFTLSSLSSLVFATSTTSTEPAKANTRQVSDWCPALTMRLPTIKVSECRNSGFVPSGTVSYNGFPILQKEIPARQPQALKILLLGGIHGDELSAAAIVFRWQELLQKNPPSGFHWKIAPVLNPDGLLARQAKRVNARGVDLNRNFPTPDWAKEAPAYWAKTTRKDPRRFPGKTPVSEPESRWVYDTIEQFKPDVIVSVHAPYGVLDFDGPANPPTRFGRLLYNRVGVYPGSLGNYSGVHKDIPVVTIELPHATQMPDTAEINRIWQDMQKWIQTNVSKDKVKQTASKGSPAQPAKTSLK